MRGMSVFAVFEVSSDGGVTIDDPLVGIFMTWDDAVERAESFTGRKMPPNGNTIQAEPSLKIRVKEVLLG